MPLPALGLLGMLGRGALAGYRTLRGIRAARTAAGMPMGYQRAIGATGSAGQKVLGTQGAGLARGTGGTGLPGMMARGAWDTGDQG